MAKQELDSSLADGWKVVPEIWHSVKSGRWQLYGEGSVAANHQRVQPPWLPFLPQPLLLRSAGR